MDAHLNLVNMMGTCITERYGVCTDMMMLLEFCDGGNLQDYMLENGPDFFRGPVEPRRLLGFLHDVSQAMEYLASKFILHSDLAARYSHSAHMFMMIFCYWFIGKMGL